MPRSVFSAQVLKLLRGLLRVDLEHIVEGDILVTSAVRVRVACARRTALNLSIPFSESPTNLLW